MNHKRRPVFAATPLGYLYAVAAVAEDNEDADFYSGQVLGAVAKVGATIWAAYGLEMQLVGHRTTRELAGRALLRAAR